MAAIPTSYTTRKRQLPTAGMTALRALEVAGLVLGKRVLVTGGNGGVGRMTIQLARERCPLTTLVRDRAASEELLGRLGAADIVENISGDYDLIVDGVGGPTFGLAIEHVAARASSSISRPRVMTRSSPSMRSGSTGRGRESTLNLPFELASHASGASDLTRLCR